METLKLKLFTYPLEEHMPGGLENKLLTLNRASLIPELMILNKRWITPGSTKCCIQQEQEILRNRILGDNFRELVSFDRHVMPVFRSKKKRSVAFVILLKCLWSWLANSCIQANFSVDVLIFILIKFLLLQGITSVHTHINWELLVTKHQILA